jgi:aspartate aminotransferase
MLLAVDSRKPAEYNALCLDVDVRKAGDANAPRASNASHLEAHHARLSFGAFSVRRDCSENRVWPAEPTRQTSEDKVSPSDVAFPRRVQNIEPSPTVVFREIAQQRLADGLEVFDLTIGEPDFDTPAHIVEAAHTAMTSGFTHYVNSRGIAELREAIADKLEKDNGLRYNQNKEILVTMGGKQGIFSVVMATVDDGDEVLVLDPTWVSYDPMVRLAGGVPVHVGLDAADDFRITEALLSRHLTSRTRMVILNSPNNPTGRVATHDELEAVASVARRTNLLVISDEIYEKLVYDGRQHVSIATLPGMAERTLVANGFSKSYAMTGWRLGYVAGPANIMDAVLKVYQHSVTCATSFAQKAAVAALTGPQDDLNAMVAEFKARRDLVYEGLNAIRGVRCSPIEGAFYALPDTSAFGSSSDVATLLLQEGGIAIVPGISFGAGCDGHIRLSFAASREKLECAMQVMRSVLERIDTTH